MLTRISGPSVEPVTLDEIKTILEIDYDEHDASIEAMISAAREKLERRCGRSFVDQTWEYRTDAFESRLEMPLRPVLEIVSVKYIDEDGDEQEVDGSEYISVIGDFQSFIQPMDEWPDDVFDRPDAVRVTFRAGYAYDEDASPVVPAENVPEGIKQAIRWIVGSMYESREHVTLTPVRQEMQMTPDSVDEIIAPFIVPRL